MSRKTVARANPKLAIENHAPRRQPGDCGGDAGEAGGVVLPGVADQTDVTAVLVRQDPPPVGLSS